MNYAHVRQESSSIEILWLLTPSKYRIAKSNMFCKFESTVNIQRSRNMHRYIADRCSRAATQHIYNLREVRYYFGTFLVSQPQPRLFVSDAVAVAAAVLSKSICGCGCSIHH